MQWKVASFIVATTLALLGCDTAESIEDDPGDSALDVLAVPVLVLVSPILLLDGDLGPGPCATPTSASSEDAGAGTSTDTDADAPEPRPTAMDAGGSPVTSPVLATALAP